MIKILIVEDDSMTRKAIEHRVKLDGYEVVSANDGKQAIEVLSNEQIDFMISDIHMPNMSGLDLVKFVRKEIKKNIPIIMLTRVGLEETVLLAFELGADDYITKPFVPTELSLRIKKALLRHTYS